MDIQQPPRAAARRPDQEKGTSAGRQGTPSSTSRCTIPCSQETPPGSRPECPTVQDSMRIPDMAARRNTWLAYPDTMMLTSMGVSQVMLAWPPGMSQVCQVSAEAAAGAVEEDQGCRVSQAAAGAAEEVR
jgi:hypothetical protein